MARPARVTPKPTSGIGISLGWWYEGYRHTLSEVRGPVCNFSPSCSRYSQQSISDYGFVKGVLLTTDRLLRCNCCINPRSYPRGGTMDQGRAVYFDPPKDHVGGRARALIKFPIEETEPAQP